MKHGKTKLRQKSSFLKQLKKKKEIGEKSTKKPGCNISCSVILQNKMKDFVLITTFY